MVIITTAHLIAFSVGVIVGSILVGVIVGLMIPSTVRAAFKKLNK